MTTLSTTQTNTFAYTGTIEFVTVQTAGYYDITADGAQGGEGHINRATTRGGGGLGAMASGEIYLAQGAVLEIVVGGEGQSASGSFGAGGGGGGGSFVIETNSGSGAVDINEVIAGGGGGGDLDVGGGGRTQPTGGNGGATFGGGGGKAGAAGQAGESAVSAEAGGGGGFTGGNGGSSPAAGSVPSNIRLATFNGGFAPNAGNSGGFGGFGGGGGGGSGGGGGGGGYGGGGGGGFTGTLGLGGGGGGGSFVNANAVGVVKTAATNSGAGSVTIAYYVVPPTITGAGGTASANAGSTTDTPFAGVTIGDANLNSSTDALTITLSDANASLSIGASHPAGVTFSNAGGGVYKLTGAAANITSELDALTLNAPATLTGAVDGVEALTFSLSDSDSADSGSPATATQTADILAPNFTKTFASTGKIQTFTAPSAGYYDITADGAQGGDGFGGLGGAGGLGAMASGAIYLAAGATLEIVVGGAGGASSQGSTGGGGGGGGGSFVIETNNGSGAVDVNEVIAAGGGGAAASAGGGGRTQPTGGNGGAPGAAGRGGGKLGGGGGGFTGGAGGTGNVAGQPGKTAGTSFAGGASGDIGGGSGGFGGGGGGGSAGGGGGGYGGGGGGNGQAFPGGGGGSFVNASATNVVLTAATNSGNGLVTIASVAGPKAANGTLTIGHGQTENITSLLDGLATPGLTGDTETLTAFSATAGTATLANGVATYAAPASGSPTISYTVKDERGATATGSVAVTVDSGPSAASGTLTIGHGQTENITSLLSGLATPGLTGDTETLTAFSATAGTATLANGVATYAAPASGSPTISYTVQDQLGDTATGSVAVTVDPGPSAASGTLTIGHGQTENITSLLSGLATPGLTGDTETLTAFSATAGTATLANGVATYAAPASGSPTISYTVQDQLGDTATGSVAVTVDPGPSAASGTLTIGHGQTENITSLLDGLATPGLTGDTETLTAFSATAGTATLANGVATYAAPASGSPTINYTVQDQLGDTASGAVNVTIDPGPTAANGSIVVGHGQSVNETALVDGLVSPGLAGDTETITAVTGNATLTNGVITYTAPVSGVDAFNYTVQDQLGDTASGTVNATIDPGPTITTATPAVVEKGQSTEIGTVAPGLAGDTLTLKQTAGSGALSLRLAGGVEEVIYTAPATVAASTPDAVTYSVNDQFGDTTSGTASIQLDAGPTITAVAPSVVEQNHSEEIGTVAPGLVGDTLILNKTSGSGALSLQVVGGVEEVIYTAPAIITSSALSAVTYTVTDQHNDAVATGSSTVPLASGNGAIVVGTAGGAVNVGNGNSAIDGRAGNETINAGNGADTVFAGTNDQITLGNGSDTIFGGSDDAIQIGNGIDAIFAAAYAAITGGTGNDSVSAGAHANVTLGNGNDTITVGDNSTLKVGNGNDTMTLGTSDAVTVGTGQDTFIYTELGGNNSIAGFLTGKDSLDFSQINPQLSVPNAPLSGNMVAPDSLAWVYQGKNAMIYINDTDNTLASSSLLLTEVTLTGVSSGLSAHNFKA